MRGLTEPLTVLFPARQLGRILSGGHSNFHFDKRTMVMKTYNSVFVALFVSDVLFCAGPPALAASGDIKEAGSAVLIGLSVTCAASTLARGDGEGARQIGGAMAVTLALTAALKYAVNEKRPNWEDHSFPSGHS
ncbi:MAG: hypothetical protein ACUVTG_10060, partial [Candidatus Oleimicrobiaceae bacterium]